MIKRNTKECHICHKQISLSNYNRHVKACENRKNHKTFPKFEFNIHTQKCICPICSKEFSKMGIYSHYFLQHTEKGAKLKRSGHYGTTGKQAWNKGLTKDTDAKVKKYSDTLKTLYTSGKLVGSNKGKPCSEITKQKISKKMMGNKNSPKNAKGYGKQGYYKGVYCASTYELAWVIYNLDHDIKFQKCEKVFEYEINGQKHRYYPDFELEDETIIEIKGIHTELVDIKANSVINKGYKYQILYKKDIQHCFNYIKEKYQVSDIAKLYDSSKEYILKTCEYCGKEFKTKLKKNQRFCSSLCASSAPKPQNRSKKLC